MKRMEMVRVWNWGRAACAGLLLVPAFALVACGGGGGGGDSTGTGSTGGGSGITAQGVVITSSNGSAVAAEALEVSTNTDAADGSTFVTGVQLPGSGGVQPMLLASAARSLIVKAPASPTLATGAAVTQACTGGGTLTMDSTASGSVPTAGDSFSITASSCTEADMVMNGSITITVVSGSYDPASPTYPKSITMRMVGNNFTVTGGGETMSFTGDVTMALTENSATSASVTMTSSSLTSMAGSHSVLLVNYSVSVTESSGGEELTVSASVQTSGLGATPVSYTITTVTPIRVSSTGQITAGSIKVTGSGSALLLTVTGTDTFSLQLDTNGDGGYESTSSVTRSQLQALL